MGGLSVHLGHPRPQHSKSGGKFEVRVAQFWQSAGNQLPWGPPPGETRPHASRAAKARRLSAASAGPRVRTAREFSK